MYYLYENHMGGLYILEEELEYDWLYCETCGDADEYVGKFETVEELEELLGCVMEFEGYDGEYLKSVLVGFKLSIGVN